MGWIVRVELPEIERERASSALWDLHTTGIAEIAEIAGEAQEASAGLGRVTLLAGFDDEAGAARARSAIEHLGPRPPAAGGDRDASAAGSEWLEATPDRNASAAGGEWWVSVEAVDERAWIVGDQYVEVVAGGRQLTLEVAGAFGHGDHPTTALALLLLADVAVRRGPIESVLDFGTGTGILSLAAAGHGACSIVAVDDDPAALAVAERNRDHNAEPGERCVIELAPALPSGWVDRFDLIIANVLLPVHRANGPALVAALRPGGSLIVSGVLHEQRREVERAYRPLRAVHERRSGDWLGVTLS